MSMDDIANRCGEWLRGTGPESDIVMSSRCLLYTSPSPRDS